MVRPGSERLQGPPICRKCGDFDARNLKPHARMPWGYSLICRSCKTGADKKRSAYTWNVINYLKSLGCQSCSEDAAETLQLHHVTKKKYHPTAHVTSAYATRIKELSKCVVLCANCHCKEHAGTLNGMPLILFSEEELLIMGEKCNGNT